MVVHNISCFFLTPREMKLDLLKADDLEDIQVGAPMTVLTCSLLFNLISLLKVWLSLSCLWLVWFCTQVYSISNAGHILRKKKNNQKTYHISKKVWKRFFSDSNNRVFHLNFIDWGQGQIHPSHLEWCRKSPCCRTARCFLASFMILILAISKCLLVLWCPWHQEVGQDIT